MDDSILEPLEAYKKSYKAQFSKALDNAFDDLVERSGIDVAANRATVKAYRAECAAQKAAEGKMSSVKALKGFCIFLIVAGCIAAVTGILLLVDGNVLAGAISLPIGAASVIAMALLLRFYFKPRQQNIQAIIGAHKRKADEHLGKAWAQMAPLNDLFDGDITKRLIEQTVPLVKLDDNFSMHRYDYLAGKYGFGANNSCSRSTIGILTGEILGNPFVVDRQLVTEMGEHTYTGSIVISWTTTYTDSEGHIHTQPHTQTLVASVTKPMPIYSKQTRLIYGNEAAPALSFSHEPSHAEKMSENQLDRRVKTGVKRIRRKQKKALKTGTSGFTEMGNEQFDVLFNALDRDNEVEFRLLFTPLAQKNMLALMTDPAGFGDDFRFYKRRCLNYISSEHSANWDMDTRSFRYCSFDVDASRRTFFGFNRQYFKSLYFDLAPLLSIPLYQQHKPGEYIYKEKYHRNYTDYEAEYCANMLGQDEFRHPASATPSILKTSLIDKYGRTDRIEVTAYSYRVEKRVDFVSVFGGDGRLHAVPVPWDEYVPIERTSAVQLKELGYTEREYRKMAATSPLQGILEGYGQHAYAHGILCCKAAAVDGDLDAKLDKFIK